MTLVRQLLRSLPVAFAIGGRAEALISRALDPFFRGQSTARIKTLLGSMELDLSEPSQRLLAYAFHNLKRHYATSKLGELIKSNPSPGTFVDIGANLGFYSLLAQEGGWRSIAFEPEPALAHFLQKNAKIFGQIFPVALSDTAGSLPLYYSADNIGATSLVEAKGYQRSKTDVPVKTFSALALDGSLGNLASIKLVKIDVEGHEQSTVAGMTEFLAAGCRPDIWCEVRGDLSGRAPGTFRAVRTLLGQFGYIMLDVGIGVAPQPAPADETLAAREVFDALFTVSRP